MSIGKNIKKLRLKHDLTQAELGKIAGVSDKAVWTWENGSAEPRMGAIQRIADYFNIRKSEILDDSTTDPDLFGLTNISYPAAYPVPILGTICAGNGVWCEENYDGEFFIDRSVKADLCLRIKGDSMIDAGINDGDYVFVKKVYNYEDGKIYAVRINGDSEAVIKVLHWQDDFIVLSSSNAEYKPIIELAENVSVIGECVGIYHAIQLKTKGG